jgi:uncharacterized membrane protein YccC
MKHDVLSATDKRAIAILAKLSVQYRVAQHGTVQACYQAQAQDLQVIKDALQAERTKHATVRTGLERALDLQGEAQRKRLLRQVKNLTRYDEEKDYHENQRFIGEFLDGAYLRRTDVLTVLGETETQG